MMLQTSPSSLAPTPNPTRRQALAAAALAGSAVVSSMQLNAVHAQGDDTLRVGLIGCGGRGTGAATQALKADSRVKLTAMADVFDDRLQMSLKMLERMDELKSMVDVPPERQFFGFDAYSQLLASDVDVVLLATPPHFRPLHLKAAVEAGKHVFAEKPVAVDTPGVHSVLQSCAEAKKKGLSVMSGLCLRYHTPFQQAVERIQDGAIGDIRTLLANDYRGPIWVKPRQPDWSDMYWQMQNWYYFTWLSGDFNVEQHIHNLDLCAWAMGDQYPVKAIGMGGREVRKGPEYGNIFDHHSVVYEYANGAQLISNTRQIAGCKSDICVNILGAQGAASLRERKNNGATITGKNAWTSNDDGPLHYQAEHDALFASIRAGTPVNNGDYAAKSTLLAIMGRMATYTGQEITWDMAWNSQEDLTPPHYEWGELATPAVAIPGVTKFV